MIDMGFVVCHEKVGELGALGRAGLEMTGVAVRPLGRHGGWVSSTYGDMPSYRIRKLGTMVRSGR
jgi:hypothetical protein